MNFIFCKLIPKHWVSRSKTLLKRRKKAIKSRPISAKKLQQQAKLFSYSKEYRALQIQKQLDKRTYASQHINELMDQIFYPDVAQAHEEAARIHLQTSALREYKDQDQSVDLISQSIDEKVLATDLLNEFNSNSQQYNIEHVQHLFQKLNQYFRNRNIIKADVEKRWKQMNEKLIKKDKNYKQRKCPYLFIDRDDTFHFQPWNTSIDITIQKLKQVVSTEQNMYDNLFRTCQIIQTIYRSVGYVPLKLYDLFEQKLLGIEEEKINKFELKQLHILLKTIELKMKIRLPVHSIVSAVNVENQTKIDQIKMKILCALLENSQADSLHLSTVINILSKEILQFTQQMESDFRKIIITNLSEISFESGVDLLDVYLQSPRASDNQLIQLIKFDVLRKATESISKQHMFKCLKFSKNKHFNFKYQNQQKIYCYDLLLHCARILCSKYCGTGSLTYTEVLNLTDILYSNKIRDINLLELTASEIVKARNQMTLNQITTSVFQIFLMGYKSPVLARILFQQHKRKYNDTRERVLKEDVKMLEGEVDMKTPAGSPDQQNFELLTLQQDLVISLWLLFKTTSGQAPQKLPVTLEDIMTIYPLSVAARHPLIYQMCLNLNNYVKNMSILWRIKISPPNADSPNISKRLAQFYDSRQQNYVDEAMRLQFQQCGNFMLNYNLESHKFVPQIWSSVNTYNKNDYVKFIKSQNQNNFFKISVKVTSQIANARRKALQQNEKLRQLQVNKQSAKQKLIPKINNYQLD